MRTFMHIGSVMIAATFALAITLDAADARRGGGGGGFRGGGGFGGGMRAGGGGFRAAGFSGGRYAGAGRAGLGTWGGSRPGAGMRPGWGGGGWAGNRPAGAAVAGQEIVPVGAADGRATDRVGEEVGAAIPAGVGEQRRRVLGLRARLLGAAATATRMITATRTTAMTICRASRATGARGVLALLSHFDERTDLYAFTPITQQDD